MTTPVEDGCENIEIYPNKKDGRLKRLILLHTWLVIINWIIVVE